MESKQTCVSQRGMGSRDGGMGRTGKGRMKRELKCLMHVCQGHAWNGSPVSRVRGLMQIKKRRGLRIFKLFLEVPGA